MKKISLFLFCFCAFIAISNQLKAQAFVVENGAGSIGMKHPNKQQNAGSWILGWNSRYFKTFRHYIGTA